ncbi:Zn-dependent oligopeptidase [Candidatus Uhrbacteria bacterium]|nr:Zn-dependent oligopeptidase [Candidatus Uhrbacteria bacterium]
MINHSSFKHPLQAITDPITMNDFCSQLLTQAKTIQQTLSKETTVTWEESFGAFDELIYVLMLAGGITSLMSVTHPDEQIRKTAKTWEPKISEFITQLYLDAAVYQTLQKTKKTWNNETAKNRLQTDILREYRRNGLDLNEAQQHELKQLNHQLTELSQAFESNLASTVGYIDIKPEQLNSLPQEYKDTHPAKDGLIRITTNTPDYVPFMKYATDRAAARELFIQSKNRAKDQNLPLLDQVLKKREQKAHLLGYKNWASYILETRMAKNPETVQTFLENLRAGIQPIIKQDLSLLYKAVGISPDQTIASYDISYANNLADKMHFNLDSQELSKYFEFARVKQGLLQTASQVFQIEFQLNPRAQLWHEDVEAYNVIQQGNIIGELYLDLHPRDEKYKHAAMFNVRESYQGETAIAALVCNFPKSSNTAALLQHEDVITFFHEFGHAIHHLLSKATFASQAGTNVARDFVEVPSQFFEEYAWDYATLKTFALHVITNEPITETMFQSLIKARNFGKGIDTIQQLYYATLDQTYHTLPTGFDTTKVMQELHHKFIPFDFVPDTHFQATFGHLMGYDAGYYGYQWALAIAKDCLTPFQKYGLYDQEITKKYRTNILEQGSSSDETDLIKNFLNRSFSPTAYQNYLNSTT